MNPSSVYQKFLDGLVKHISDALLEVVLPEISKEWKIPMDDLQKRLFNKEHLTNMTEQLEKRIDPPEKMIADLKKEIPSAASSKQSSVKSSEKTSPKASKFAATLEKCAKAKEENKFYNFTTKNTLADTKSNRSKYLFVDDLRIAGKADDSTFTEMVKVMREAKSIAKTEINEPVLIPVAVPVEKESSDEEIILQEVIPVVVPVSAPVPAPVPVAVAVSTPTPSPTAAEKQKILVGDPEFIESTSEEEVPEEPIKAVPKKKEVVAEISPVKAVPKSKKTVDAAPVTVSTPVPVTVAAEIAVISTVSTSAIPPPATPPSSSAPVPALLPTVGGAGTVASVSVSPTAKPIPIFNAKLKNYVDASTQIVMKKAGGSWLAMGKVVNGEMEKLAPEDLIVCKNWGITVKT